ncbi:MAG: serine/threonine protein kinase [Deltaproteobacteria bacterium]|nr:serine/threonine protein kinase [Deltaproteobacteria bacterium]
MQLNIKKGTVLGDRFRVDAVANSGDMGQIYRALDQKTNTPVALRVIPDTLINSSDTAHITARVQQASALTHKNIRATFGMGHMDNFLFIASQWVDGHNLQSLLEKRKAKDARFSFKGAYNIIGHICNALTYAHQEGAYHGSLSPRAIIVNKAGRVKVHDWALSTIRISKPDYPGREKDESLFWAPEVLKDFKSTSTRSDIYSVGAIFYTLITGRVPQRPLRAPSKLGFSKEVDSVVARCMSADPKQRFMTAKEVKQAIAQLAKSEAEAAAAKSVNPSNMVAASVDDDLGIDIDVDFDTEPNEVIEKVTTSGGMLNAPGLPPITGGGGSFDNRASMIDMGSVMSGNNQIDAAKWMVQKDKFDHGPFSDRELVQMILRGDALGNHKLTNMDTGERKTIRTWGTFDEYLERYRIKKKEMDEIAALEKTEKAEKRGGFFMGVVVLGVLGVLGLAVGGYFLNRKLREEKTLSSQEMVSAFESGEIKINMGSGAVNKKWSGKRKRRKGEKGGRTVDGGLSYEDAMNMGMSLGDLSGSGGQKLTAVDINNIMSRNVRKFLPCMSGESVKRVDMDIAVGGDGKVIGASVRQGSSKMKSCIVGKVRSIKFPQSNQPRTATSWYFELY